MPDTRPSSLKVVAIIVGIAALFGWLVWHPPSPSSQRVVSQADPGIPPARSRPRDAPVGDFFVLVDISGSLRPKQDPHRLQEAVGIVRGSVRSLADMEEVLPIRVRVATIGDRGLDQEAACDLFIPRSTLFVPSDTSALSDSLEACARSLLTASATPYTDIRGSLKFAGEALAGSTPRLRGIFVVSDLVEEIAPGNEPAVPELTGLCVLTFVQTTPEAARRPDVLDVRVAEWGRQLTAWRVRAKDVRFIAAFSPDEVVHFFRGCEGNDQR